MAIPPVEIDFQIKGIAEVQRAFRTVEQSALRFEKSRASASATANKSVVSASEKSAREQVRVWQRADQMQARAQRDAVRDVERAERDKARVAQTWVAKRERDELDSARRIANARERLGRAMGRAVSGGARNAMGVAAGLATTANHVLGGFGIADSVRSVTSNQGLAAQISNMGFNPKSENASNRVRRSTDDIFSRASSVGTREGMDTNEVLQGLDKFVSLTGDLDKGMGSMSKLGELATATGASFGDLASAFAEVVNADPKATLQDSMTTLRGLAAQGQLASVEIKDLAKRAALITSSAGLFEGDKQSNIITLGAMAQSAKLSGGAANAAEATTGVARFADDVALHRDRFDALKIQTKGKGGVLRDPKEIIKDTLRKTGGDVSAIGDLFGVRSKRPVQGFAEIYRKAGGNSKDPKAQAKAMEAVEAEFKRLAEATMSETETTERAAMRRQAADRQFASVMNQLRDAVGHELLPEFVKLVPKIRDAIPQLTNLAQGVAQVADWFVSNPFKGLGMIVAAQIGKELATAAIGQLISKALSTSAGQGIAIAAAAIAIEQAGEIAISQMVEEKNKTMRGGVEAQSSAGNSKRELLAKIKAGTATPEDIEKARAISMSVQNSVAKQQGSLDVDKKSLTEKLVGGAGMLLGGDEFKEALATEQKAQTENLKATKTALDDLNKAIASSAEALRKQAEVAGTGGMHDPHSPARNQPMSQRGGSTQ